jgi:DNA repair protein RadD
LENDQFNGCINDPQKRSLQALLNFNFTLDQANSQKIALIVLPTGTGKSGVASLAPYVLEAKRVLILTPSSIITNQLFSDLCGFMGETFYERRGIIASNQIDRDAFIEQGYKVKGGLSGDQFTREASSFKLVIANAHKFGSKSAMKIEDIPNTLFDLVIVDEAHHYPARTWKDIVDHFRTAKKVFLTATPIRTHKNKLTSIVGASLSDQLERFTAFNYTRQDAIEAGIIRDLDPLQIAETQYNTDEAAYPAVIDNLIKKIREHDKLGGDYAHQAMIIVKLVDEANSVVDLYNGNERKIGRAVALHGKVERTGFDQFKAGLNDIRVLVVCGSALEGFDRKEISVLGICRNISSIRLFTQVIGRVIRRHERDPDDFRGCVISHRFFKQEANFNQVCNSPAGYWADSESDSEDENDENL